MRCSPSLLAPLLLSTLAPACADDPGPAGGTTLTLHTQWADKVAFAPVGGDWELVEPDADGIAEIPIDGPYQLVITCRSERRLVTAYQGAPEDGDALWRSCAPDSAAGYANVTLEMPADAWVTLGGGGNHFSRRPGEVMVTTPGVPMDLIYGEMSSVAIGAPKIEIQRDVVFVPGDQTVTFTGTHVMEQRALTLAWPGEPVEVDPLTIVSTSHGYLEYTGGNDFGQWVFPAGALEADERQYVGAAWNSGDHARTISGVALPGGTGTVPVELAAPIADADRVAGALPAMTYDHEDRDWSGRSLSVESGNLDWYFYETRAGRVDDAETLTFPDVTTIPGWEAGWTVDTSATIRLNLWVQDDERFDDLYWTESAGAN